MTPTVWAVTDASGTVIDIGMSAHDAVKRAWQTGMNDNALYTLASMVMDNHGGVVTSHGGYTVAPMHLVSKEALAVVEAADKHMRAVASYHEVANGREATSLDIVSQTEKALTAALAAYRAATPTRDAQEGTR